MTDQISQLPIHNKERHIGAYEHCPNSSKEMKKMVEISKDGDPNYLVQGGLLYWAFSLCKDSRVRANANRANRAKVKVQNPPELALIVGF